MTGVWTAFLLILHSDFFFFSDNGMIIYCFFVGKNRSDTLGIFYWSKSVWKVLTYKLSQSSFLYVKYPFYSSFFFFKASSCFSFFWPSGSILILSHSMKSPLNFLISYISFSISAKITSCVPQSAAFPHRFDSSYINLSSKYIQFFFSR